MTFHVNEKGVKYLDLETQYKDSQDLQILQKVIFGISVSVNKNLFASKWRKLEHEVNCVLHEKCWDHAR